MSATLSRSLTLAAACWGYLSEQAAFDRTIEVRCASASPDEKAAVRSILYCALRRAVFGKKGIRHEKHALRVQGFQRLQGVVSEEKPGAAKKGVHAIASFRR